MSSSLDSRSIWRGRGLAEVKLGGWRMAHMFDGNHLACGLFNGLVHHTKAAACSQSQEVSHEHRRGGRGGGMRTAKLLQHLVVTSNAFVGHCGGARANGRRICLMSQKKKLSPGQGRGGQGGGGGGRRARERWWGLVEDRAGTWMQGIPGREKGEKRVARRVERRRVDDNEIDQWRRLGLSSLIAGPGLVDGVLRHGPLFTLLCDLKIGASATRLMSRGMI